MTEPNASELPTPAGPAGADVANPSAADSSTPSAAFAEVRVDNDSAAALGGDPKPQEPAAAGPQEESAVESSAEAASDRSPPVAPPPRPFWQAFGHALVHLFAFAALMFVLVGLAPRVERLFNRMQFDDRSGLTTFVFEAGYFVRANWFLGPLVLLFDLGVLLILRRSGDAKLARNYTTIVVGIALALSILFGYALLTPLGELYRQYY